MKKTESDSDKTKAQVNLTTGLYEAKKDIIFYPFVLQFKKMFVPLPLN